MFNLFVVLVITFIISFILIYFIASHDRRLKKKQDQINLQGQPNSPTPDFRLFTKFCTDLCEYLKLEIQDISRPYPDELVIKAANANPITRVDYLVVGFFAPPHQEIEATKIMEISDQIVSERLSKGIIITPGFFPETVKGLPELAPLEFIDGVKIQELQKKIVL